MLGVLSIPLSIIVIAATLARANLKQSIAEWQADSARLRYAYHFPSERDYVGDVNKWIPI